MAINICLHYSIEYYLTCEVDVLQIIVAVTARHIAVARCRNGSYGFKTIAIKTFASKAS